ncbi:class I SAM-dependent methyltransferase [Streptomyces sp. NPDC060194]|uniref:class I SAM-dependent methyltransferase n=1 Tax=Streptomyces sp. NPDC060194 TaxID=3347069 RepID=UPI00365D5808
MTAETAEWEWDHTLFAGAAAHYERGRLPYAPGLSDALRDALGLDGTGRLLDVGCGPGTLALRLAPLFSEIVGVDPDHGMIAEAQWAAGISGLGARARWLCIRAEQLPYGLDTFDVATFGQSFHWMDQPQVATTVLDMLRPGGAFVHVSHLQDEDLPVADLPWPAIPHAAIDQLIQSYLGPVRRAGRGLLPNGTRGGEAEALTAAGFEGPQRLVIPAGQPLERVPDDIVAAVFSTSSSTPHQFGAQRGDFEAALRRLLARTSPTGPFSARRPSTEIHLWRRPSD